MANNNPISFYDDDGRDVKDPSKKLRELYPRVDSTTGEVISHYTPGESGRYYRDIKKIPGDIPFFPKTVNYRAVEIGPTGKELYLLTGKERAKRAVIYAHGVFDPYNIKEFYLTPSSPKFSFLTPHGSRLLAYVRSIIRSYALTKLL